MRKMRSSILLLMVALAILLGLGAVAACGNSANQPVATAAYYTPDAPMMYNGVPYCAWMYTPDECIGSPWHPAPGTVGMAAYTTQPTLGSLAYAFFVYHMTYHLFYDSGSYYDGYLAPHHVTVNRITYINTVNNFDRTNKRQEAADSSNARYKSSTGQRVNGNQVPTNAFSGGNGRTATNAPAATRTRGAINQAPAIQPTPKPRTTSTRRTTH